jgi:hypothetical protein
LLLFPAGIFGFLFSIVFVAIFTFGFLRDWKVKVHKAQFYEDHFRLTGRALNKTLTYSEISQVLLLETPTYFLPPKQLHIETKQNEQFVIFGDPRNKELNRDLYDWIKAKSNRTSS